MSLDDLRDARGRFSILAIDHRDSLRVFLRPDDPDSIAPEEITDLKRELIEGIADMATGVMLEPEYSIPQLVDALPAGVGFLAALESQGYLSDPEASPTTILDGWSIEQAQASGAASAKLLLPYRPDRADHAAAQEQVGREIVDACRSIGFPIAVEPLYYRLGDDDLADPNERASVVVETARRFAAMQPDLLKLPYPGTTRACADITEIAAEAGTAGPSATPIPWAMLSGGGTFDGFADQFAEASHAGCSGFMVGRALWGECVRAPASERAALLREQVAPRFAELVGITVNT